MRILPPHVRPILEMNGARSVEVTTDDNPYGTAMIAIRRLGRGTAIQIMFTSPGAIPGNLFRTGRWPLPASPDAIAEFGIDLDGWPVIEIGQRFTLSVSNIGLGAMPWRGTLEVLTVRP